MLLTHLLCGEIVLRAILKASWLDESGRITATAFIRDPRRDPDGLSVNLRAFTNVDVWLSESFKKSFGVDSLHSGKVRDLELEIGQTKEDAEAGNAHALIVGVPSTEEDPKLAEDLATELRNISRTIDRVRRTRKD